MKAIVYQSPGQLAVAETSQDPIGPKDVLVRTEASGLCHTDIDVLHQRYGEGSFPVIPGHEYSGTVLEVGSEVESVAVGARVVVDPNIHCGECRSCQRGLFNLCVKLGAYGVSVNGGFAETSVVAEEAVLDIGDMPFHLAALSEPIGCVLNGLTAIEAKRTDEAIIFGAGPIGVLMGLALTSRGSKSVHIVDLAEERLALAESMGLSPIEAGSSEIDALARNLDLAVDATGVPAVAQGLLDLVADGGTALFFGVCPPKATVEIEPFQVFRRQLTIAGAHSLNHNLDKALAVLKDLGPVTEKVISHRLTLEGVAEIIESPRPGGTMKVQYAREA